MTTKIHVVFKLTLMAALVASSITTSRLASAAAHDGPGPGCVTHIGLTYRSGSIIHGEGSGGCTGGSCSGTRHLLESSIQRLRWFGWEALVWFPTYRTPPFQVWLPVAYNCAGTGTHTFRTRMIHQRCGYPTKTRYSNEIRETC
jgi:hypothetical protein